MSPEELAGAEQLEVTGIMPDSWAAEVGLHIGDLVSAVNGEDLQRVEAERFKDSFLAPKQVEQRLILLLRSQGVKA
eukprot:1793627-Amphidinium_carterae.1